MNIARGLLVTCLLLAWSSLWADNYGSINGRQLKIGPDDQVNVHVDYNGKLKLADTGAQAGNSCDDAGALVRGEGGIPLLCHAGKWAKLLPLVATQSGDCPANHFVTVSGNALVCKQLQVVSDASAGLNKVNNSDEKKNEVSPSNFNCFIRADVSSSPSGCSMDFASDLVETSEFQEIQANANKKFTKKTRNLGPNLFGENIPTDEKKPLTKQISLADAKYPYFIFLGAQGRDDASLKGYLALAFTNSSRIIKLGFERNQIAMLAIDRQKVDDKDTYRVLAAYFRNRGFDDDIYGAGYGIGANDMFRDAYYKLIPLADGEVPATITYTMEYSPYTAPKGQTRSGKGPLGHDIPVLYLSN